MSRLRFLLVPALLVAIVLGSSAFAAEDVEVLKDEIQGKEQRISELQQLIGNYRTQIEERQAAGESLANQLALLENRVAEKELAIERAKTEIEALGLEIRVLDAEVSAQEQRILTQQALLAELIRDINATDTISTLDVLLTKPSLSTFFAQVEEVKQLQGDLSQALERVRGVKKGLEEKRKIRQAKQEETEEERRRLEREQLALEAEKNIQASLIAQTQSEEQAFQRILYELRQQQQDTATEVARLEDRIRLQLNNVDDALARGDVLFSWPLDVSRGITAIFHDPTYPFRHLFEHSGTDIRASVGTPVKAAGGGYVAWNRTGRLYGNYTMLVHAGGFATVYAHLSKFVASPDTYVERGETIALSGGAAGAPGSGLSSGPHLHFEVRADGIPVDPEHYLPQVPNSYYDYYDEYKALGVRL